MAKAIDLHESMRRMLGATSVLEFAREVLKFPAEGTQAAVLENAPRYKTIVLNCSRQWGRSTVVAAMAVYRMIKVRGATVLIVAPVGRQSGETLAKARGFLRVMGLKWKSDGVNDQSSMLANGSRIVSLPATRDTLRGYSAVSMLIIDEAAYVEDEVYLSLRPSLAVSDGDLILLSTPCGRRGFFYREMTEADDGSSFRHTGPVTECSHIREAFLKKERKRGDLRFRQEYLCEFIETGRHPFDQALLDSMVAHGEKAWDWA